MGGTATLSDLGFQPQTAPAQAPGDAHPLADLGFKPAQPAHPLADLGFKPAAAAPPPAGAGPLGAPGIPAAPVPAGLQTAPVAAIPSQPAPPPGPPVAGAGPLGVPQLPAHPDANLQPSLAGELAGATKEAATHPIETLTGADLPSQTEQKQALLTQAAAAGDPMAKSALEVQKTAQAPTLPFTETKTFQKVLDPKSKNIVSRVLTGGSKALEALSSPDNLELIAAMPFAPEDATQLLSGVFSAQMAQGAGEQGYEAIKAAHRGDYGEAAERGATALINAAMAAASAKHAAGKEVSAPTSDNVPRGTAQPEAEKPVLHTSNDVEELRQSAERQAPEIGDKVAAATEGIPGAKLEAVRDSKDTDRIEDKADRQGVEPNQIADIAAAKVTVPDQAAADKVLAKLHEQMPVESVNGSLDEPGKNGVRQVQAVVNTAKEGEPVQRAEVLIQTPEMHEATDKTHDDYRRSQELRAAGKDAEADALEAKITKEHEAAANAGKEEPKYKFGSTQTNIPKDSDAAQALSTARGKIDKADLISTDYGGDSKGLELYPHVTLRYGLKGEDTEKLRKFIESQAPFEAKLGKTDAFPASEHSDGAAPIIAPIDAPELHRIEAEIDNHGDFAERSFPDYKPHATLGYVKPEAAEKYKGMAETEGKTFKVNSIAITDRNGNATEIPLKGVADDAGRTAEVARRPQEEAGATGRGTERPATSAVATEATRKAEGLAPKPPAARPDDTGLRSTAAAGVSELKAPKPPQPKEGFTPGRQETPVEVRVDGKWQPATLDFYGHGADWQLRRSRATLDSGAKVNNLKDADIRAAKEKGPVEGITSGVGDQTKPSHGAIAYDLDKTLAHFDGYKGPTEIGKPIESEVASLKSDLAAGKDVWIFSARAADAEAIPAIKAWTKEHLGKELPVTNVKYPEFARFVDDRAEKPGYMEGGDGKKTDAGGGSEQLGKGTVPARTATSDGGGDDRPAVLRHEELGGGGDTRNRTERDVSSAAPASQADRDDERSNAGDAVRREPQRKDVEAAANDARKSEWDKQVAEAKVRTLSQNAAAHKSKVIDVAGRKALALDADGALAWHKLFKSVRKVNDVNPLGAGADWRGMTLNKQQVTMAMSFLRAMQEDIRVAGVPEERAAAGYERLAEMLKDARNDQGSAVVLRGDYRDDTAREEATHQWQMEHGLDRSDAMLEVASRPEFQETADQLREMGYRDAPPRVVANEMMAKAMAGDRDLSLTDEERDNLVRSFLTEAVEEKGPEILKNLPETDERVKAILNEVKRGYDYGAEYDQTAAEDRDAGSIRPSTRGDRGAAGEEVREADGTGARERGRQSDDQGLQRRDEKAAPAQGELKPPKPPDKQTAKAEPTTGSDEPVFQRLVESKDKDAQKQNPWFLKSARVLEQKMKGPMPGDALVRMLENNGVKADEIKWSGLEDLKGKARVTPEQVAEHLAENAIKVKEVTKGRAVPEKDGMVSMDDVTHPDAPKYASYQLPGGTNYRELLMTMPGDKTETLQRMKEQLSDWQKGPDFYFNSAEEYREKVDDLKAEIAGLTEKSKAFQSSHWDEPNVLAHVRMNDRTTPDGKKLLHLEEIQSDWHQAGRAKGYATGDATMDRIMGNTVPDAPFKKDWHEMAFRRMVKEAADNGYDGLSWTPGEKQAERYDLSKHISRIDYGPSKSGDTATITAFDKGGSHIFTKNNVPHSEWPEIVGKEIATKMDSRVGEANDYTGYHSLKGVDLKVGGEGMKGFYDKIIPDYARKFGKQWGAKVGEENLSNGNSYKVEPVSAGFAVRGDDGRARTTVQDRVDAEKIAAHLNKEATTAFKVPYLEITPEMRKDVAEQGVPLFQKTKGEENPVARSVSDLVDDLKKLPKTDKGTALDRVANWTKDSVEESLARSGKALGGVPSAFEKAFAWAKATTAALVHDYTHPLEQTDWKNVMGQHQLAQSETALKLQDMAKELKAQAPKELDRIAMTHYMEANGSDAKLKEWQAGNKARAMSAMGSERARYLREAQKHYDKALDLTPEQKTLAKRLRQHFNDTLDIAKENGLLEYGYRNYVMHIYEKDEAADLLHLIDTNDLNPNPSFIKRRFHETLYDAEGAGLTPKSKDIGFLSTAYDKSLNEGIASRTAIKNLLDAKAADGRPIAAIKTTGGWVIEKGDDARQVLNQRARPQTMSMEGYKSVDRPQLRNFLFKPTTADLQGIDPQYMDEDLAFRGDLMIHPKFVSRVEDMLTSSWFERGETVPQKIGQKVLQGSAAAKEAMTLIAPFHLATEGRHALSHKINPFKVHTIDLTDPTQRLLASHGLTLTNYDAEGLFATKALKGLAEPVPGINKAMDMVHKFSQWQFQEYIPGLKMAMAKEAFDRNTERYPKLTKEQVAELSAKESNAAFGNLNTTFDKIPRTKTFKSLARLAMFAPDFLESRARFMGQAFTKYGGEQRAALIRSALITYATMRIGNALLNNGDAKWDPEHAFSLVVHGKSYSVRSVEQDALHAVTDPRSFIYNRLNPLTTRPLTEFLSGRDQYGRQKSVTSQAKDVAKSTLPFGVQKVIQTPDESLMDSLLTSIGLGTTNYRSPTEEAVHKLYLANIPPGADDETKEAESRKLRGYEDKVRSGHMSPAEVWAKVEKKEITAQEAGRTVRRAQKSRLEYEFSHLHLKDAIDVYAKATPLEQAELRPEFARKQAAIAALPEAQREKTAEKMQELLAKNQQ